MSKSIEYYKALDTLRAIAVFLVLLHHFLPDTKIGSLNFGFYGVDLFFTISGFLITSILLNQKYSVKALSRSKFLSTFYIRRCLRIFPIYFLFLFFLFIVQNSTKIKYWDHPQIIYYLTYTTNLLFFKSGFQNSLLNHLWSLGVEEQFYLLWPLVIVFVKKEHLVYYILMFIVVGFSTNIVGKLYNISNIRFLPFSNFHTLGIGVLLAYFIFTKNEQLEMFRKHINSITIISILLFSINYYVIQKQCDYNWIGTLLNELIIVLFTFFLVYRFIIEFHGILGTIFNLKYFRFIGKISYGIYIYHKIIPAFLSSIFYKLGYKMDQGYIYFVICVFVTILVSTLSWYCIESPILQLKNRYDF